MSEVDNKVESEINEVEQNANEVESENNVVEQSEDVQDTAAQIEQEKQKVLSGQIASAKKDLITGDKSFDELPGYLQKHLKDAPRAVVKKEEMEAVETRVYNRIKEEAQAEKIADIMDEADVSREDRKAYEAEYEELKEAGLSPAKAMNKALKLSGVEGKLAESKRYAKLKGSMGLPPQGNPRSNTESTVDWNKTPSQEDQAKFFKSVGIKYGKQA